MLSTEYRLGNTAANALREVSELPYACCSCETDAVRRAAARLFVQDAQNAVPLPESGSRRSRDRLSDSHMPLWASRTNSVAAGRRRASVSQLQQAYETVHVRMQRVRRRALRYLEIATPTRRHFCFPHGGCDCLEACSNCMETVPASLSSDELSIS